MHIADHAQSEMDGRRAVLCVLALLAAGIAEVAPFTLDSMTWDAASVLTVCPSVQLDNVTIAHLTVKHSNNSQTDYEGDTVTEDLWTCATFADVPGPEAEPTTYELAVGFTDSSEQQGLVKFAFPLSDGTTVNCGTSQQYGRFNVAGELTSPFSESCLSDSPYNLCYVPFSVEDPAGTFCTIVLDQNSAGATINVCVPGGTPIDTTPDLITAVSLTYADATSTDSFTITSGVNPLVSLELLSQVSGDTDVSVSTCAGSVCQFDSSPSGDAYNLCGVFVDLADVTDVGTFVFQDLQLTVDTVGTTTLDFHFLNKDSSGDRIYNVYGAPSQTLPDEPSFTLDCHLIPPESFCNGFFDDDPLPAVIGVSFPDSGANKVIAPVPTSTFSSVYGKNTIARDIVPSSA